VLDKVKEVLEKEVLPYLRSHGGGLEVVEVTPEKDVIVELTGACSGCPASQVTLETIVAETLKEKVPGIRNVVVNNTISRELLDTVVDILKGGTGGLLER